MPRPGVALTVTTNDDGVASVRDSVSVVVKNPVQFNEVIRSGFKKMYVGTQVPAHPIACLPLCLA